MEIELGMLLKLLLCCCVALSTAYDEEMIAKGELRKACSKRGNPLPPPARVNTTMRLIAIRQLMSSEVQLGTHPVDAYIVTSSDEHQSVETDEYDRRREYISGFSGSYGDAIITMNKAVLWTDGRYHLQADEQIDCNWLLMREGRKNIPTRAQWLKAEFPNGARLGANPKIISEYMWKQVKHELAGAKIHLIALNVSLVDEIWPKSERPKKRTKDAFVLDFKYTGKNYTAKLEEVRNEVKKAGANAMVVTSLDEIAWLLNIRGRDIPFSPFLRSYLILDMDNVFLYVNSKQLEKNDVLSYLHAQSVFKHYDTVQIRNYSDLWIDLRTKSQLYNKILLPSHCVYSEGASHAIYEHIIPEKRLPHQSPIIYLKSVKNAVEIEGMKRAHVKDGAAMCDFFAYIEAQMVKGKVFTEMDMANILDDFRFEQLESLGNSFRTIVGFAGNGAQPHYIPTKNTNAIVFHNGTVVIESGGQYYEGTTSVTRTIHYGEPDEMMKEAYTRVLVGQISFSVLTFPNNMKIADADILARGPLWEVGLDYLHETGHGVGSFLGVRESPIAIQYDLEVATKQTFQPGYYFTIEPGYYREGYFGVRLQNIFQVVEKPWLQHTSGHKYLGFKTLTLVPYQQKLMTMHLLSTHQRKWLNRYNEEIRQEVGAELKRQGKMDGFYWMMENTKYIPENSATKLSSGICLALIVAALGLAV
ncbi:xaa-Pro aminopeptidase ApepP isoform X1 [Dendroctonus ponderosae]|uniref:xaa-Pro aminopeptidase ApepP isoform X1 n=2 Tax=Dendroctonus ponderosae TaxID=77166 RepID=UPI0020350FCB|nr:xaa-Pro aminopeptidase ApepP isoform X1 [Dendroctonus ponderosae]